MNQQYETVIGLEIHVELSTKSKIFCACSTEFGKSPNTNICPVCTGMPGALPVLNREVVEDAIAVGLALHCAVRPYSRFDRKNYFYPDNPQNYQITQLYYPVCHSGWMEILCENGNRKIRIHEIHMEEDAGKLIHDTAQHCSCIDYNRSGVPLLEIVTLPDFRTSDEVVIFLEKLRKILRYLGVSDCRLQEGSMRVDVNLSLKKPDGNIPGTRTEMKNLNSFRSIRRAVNHEQERQAALLGGGGKVIQETRRWDDARGSSFSMRAKEKANDYRYFPEPDLPPVRISDEWIERVRNSLPEFQEQKAERFARQYHLTAYDAELLTESRNIADLFEKTAAILQQPRTAAHWLTGEAFRLIREYSVDPDTVRFDPAHLAALIQLIDAGTVSSQIAKQVFEKIFLEDVDPAVYISRNHLETVRDTDTLKTAAAAVIDEYPAAAEQYRQGKEKVLGYLLGQLMRKMNGQADPRSASEILRRLLNSDK